MGPCPHCPKITVCVFFQPPKFFFSLFFFFLKKKNTTQQNQKTLWTFHCHPHNPQRGKGWLESSF